MVTRKRLVTAATKVPTMLMYMGRSPSISATSGAKIVAVRAVTLQKPNTVAVSKVGVSYTNAMKHMLKLAAIPNLAIDMKTGMRSM